MHFFIIIYGAPHPNLPEIHMMYYKIKYMSVPGIRHVFFLLARNSYICIHMHTFMYIRSDFAQSQRILCRSNGNSVHKSDWLTYMYMYLDLLNIYFSAIFEDEIRQ